MILDFLGAPGVIITDEQTLAFCDAFAELGREAERADSEPKTVRSQLPQTNTIAIFDRLRCPDGWEPASSLQGRYVVGVLPNRTVGRQVGDAFSMDGENRPTGRHSHSFQRVAPQGDLRPGNGLAAGGGVDRRPRTDATSDLSEQGIPAGTNAPYVQLLACRRS